MEDIGYALDFKEIKRVGCQWIDDLLDHGMILNAHDETVIETVKKLNSKLWLMTLNGPGEYCNPSVENISKEIFLAQEMLFAKYEMLKVYHLRLYETPNCYTDCYKESISEQERNNFSSVHKDQLAKYAHDLGMVEYDDRKLDTQPSVEDEDQPLVETKPVENKPAHTHMKGAGSSVGASMMAVPDKKGDQFAPERKVKKKMFKQKPSSMTDDPSKHTWNFGTKWL
jgi:6-pyruvoyltetrahydropterin/6-carboxytetrahydropterin synthase